MNNLALLLQAQGKFDEAELLCRKTLRDRQDNLGDADTDTLISTSNLATLLKNRGKLDEAEPLFRKALEGFRRHPSCGAAHKDTLACIYNLADLLFAQDNFSLIDAVPLFREALLGRRRTLGDAHSATRDTAMKLAKTLRNINDVTGAEEVEKLLSL